LKYHERGFLITESEVREPALLSIELGLAK
jgi:hypothetical protein